MPQKWLDISSVCPEQLSSNGFNGPQLLLVSHVASFTLCAMQPNVHLGPGIIIV